jgi:hypothetical protein
LVVALHRRLRPDSISDSTLQLLHRLAGRQRFKTGLHFAVLKWIWKLVTFRDPPARIIFRNLIR